MKTVLLCPGNKQDLTTHPYKNTIKAIEKAGYKVKFAQIQWKHTTINDWGPSCTKNI